MLGQKDRMPENNSWSDVCQIRRKGYVLRPAKIQEGGLQRQLFDMAKSNNLAEFKRAVGHRALVFHNVMYADVEGNIWYVYNSATPRRDPSLDWASCWQHLEIKLERLPRTRRSAASLESRMRLDAKLQLITVQHHGRGTESIAGGFP